MPFTFAHPAVVLPLNYIPKKWVSLTGLVVGSLIPDFEYFIRMNQSSLYSHTWTGLFWFDVPLAFVVAFVFHNIIRDQFIQYAPAELRNRLWRYKGFNWNEYLKKNAGVILYCFFIGSISHLLLDKFTHRTVHYINQLPALQDQNKFEGYHQLSYFLFWDFNSLIGLVIVAYSLWQLPPDTTNQGLPIGTFWRRVGIIGAGIYLIRFLLFDSFSIPNAVVSAISCILLSLLVVCIWFKRHSQPSI